MYKCMSSLLESEFCIKAFPSPELHYTTVLLCKSQKTCITPAAASDRYEPTLPPSGRILTLQLHEKTWSECLGSLQQMQTSSTSRKNHFSDSLIYTDQKLRSISWSGSFMSFGMMLMFDMWYSELDLFYQKSFIQVYCEKMIIKPLNNLIILQYNNSLLSVRCFFLKQ